MKIQILLSPGCSHGQLAAGLVAEVARGVPGAEVETLLVATLEDAARLSFPGSPTIRVDGRDIEPGPPRTVGLG